MIQPWKYGVTNIYSYELFQSETIGLEQLLAETAARELGLSVNAHLTTGTGTTQPNGFISAGTNGGTATGTGTTYGTYFGHTDLVSLFYSLAAPYRSRGTWQANATTIAQIRNARSTTGEFLWAPAPSAGAPETILGRPLVENPSLANGSAAKAIAFGDFKRYIVLRAGGLRVDMSRDYKFSTDQLALRTIEQVSGDLPDAIAIKYLVNAAV